LSKYIFSALDGVENPVVYWTLTLDQSSTHTWFITIIIGRTHRSGMKYQPATSKLVNRSPM